MTQLRRSWSIACLALLLALGAPATQAQLDEIHLTTVDWAPFYGADLPDNGFITQLARAAFERAGYQTRVDFIPWARALHDVDQGVRHVLLGAYYTDERAERFVASDRMYTTQIGLVTRDDVGVREYESLRDLTGYSIGYGRGWATSEEFDNADYLNRIPEDDNVLNVRKLYAERIDMVAMNFDRFLAIAAEEGLDPGRAVFVEPPLDQNGLYLMASRAIPEGEQIIADFNRELAAMREDGTYDAILADFGLR